MQTANGDELFWYCHGNEGGDFPVMMTMLHAIFVAIGLFYTIKTFGIPTLLYVSFISSPVDSFGAHGCSFTAHAAVIMFSLL